MSNLKKISGLTKKEIKVLNYKSVKAFDKWHRMFCGCASSLDDYKNTVIYLRIENTQKKFPSNQESALKFVEMWKSYNPETLGAATAYIVKFYHTKITGFSMSMSDLKDKDGLDLLIEQLKNSDDEEKELFATFTGMLI